MIDERALLAHLESAALSGSVSTTVRNTRGKIDGLFAGDPRCRFGLSVCDTATPQQIDAALESEAGASLDADETSGHIDPHRSLAGILAYGRALGTHLARGRGRALVATGHPAGLLGHYATIAATLEAHGLTVVTPLDGGPELPVGFAEEPPSSIRYVSGVACVYRKPGTLAHSHLPDYMNAMLDVQREAGEPIDLVIGDHGMAGAAVERDIPTLAIADVNDIPLLLTAGLTHHTVLVIDDNRPAQLFRPVTDAILEEALRHVR
jgi:hypothetical protein